MHSRTKQLFKGRLLAVFHHRRLQCFLQSSVCLVASQLATPQAYSQPPEAFSFTPLGSGTEALGVSADGRTVVGRRLVNSTWQPFQWRNGQLSDLGELPGDWQIGEAHAASADGSVIVGALYGPAGEAAFRWTLDGGFEEIGPGIATDLSNDGALIVGIDMGNEVFRWEDGIGRSPVDLLDPTKPPGTSADGSIVVGQRQDRATAVEYGSTFAPEIIYTNSNAGSYLTEVSGDGSMLVGVIPGPGVRPDVYSAFAVRSNGSAGVILHAGSPAAVSHDASVIVTNPHPVFYIDDVIIDYYHLGLYELRERLLDSGLESDLDGWGFLGEGSGVSGDGNHVVGTHPENGGWIVRFVPIPEPSSAMLLIIGLLTWTTIRASVRRAGDTSTE